MKSIILASTSKRRNELLRKLGLKFKVVAPIYKETLALNLPPTQLVKFLAKEKAKSVAKFYRNHIIIAADTLVFLKNQILGKPRNLREAKKMLRKISGKTLFIITGFIILDTKENKFISKAVKTKVFIKKLSNLEIANYIKTKEPLDKAGAFAIQGFGALFIKKIEGDYFNAVGLPLYDLGRKLKKFGVHII
jgi:septum formation protein